MRFAGGMMINEQRDDVREKKEASFYRLGQSIFITEPHIVQIYIHIRASFRVR